MGKRIPTAYRINRTAFSVANLRAPTEDIAFWGSQTAALRWQAMELLRHINYGKAATTGRLKRVLEVAQLKTS